MKNKKIYCFVFLILVCSKVFGGCLDNEIIVFSFLTVSGNDLSVCREENNKYLVYKYGKGDNYFQYPKRLDHRSWGEFSFSGMRRPGGKMNAGFGDYDLTFINSGFEYSIFQKWDDEKSSYEIGVLVRNLKTKRVVKINGLMETQKGSLVLLEGNKYISNSAFEEK